MKANLNISENEKKDEEEEFNRLFNEETIKISQENYEKVKDNYMGSNPFHWAWKIFKNELNKGKNPTLSFICKKLGLEKMYYQTYGLNSIVVHSQPPMSNMLIQKGGITPSPNFNETIKNIAASSSSLVIDIILLVLEFAKSPKYQEINDYLMGKWLSVY